MDLPKVCGIYGKKEKEQRSSKRTQLHGKARARFLSAAPLPVCEDAAPLCRVCAFHVRSDEALLQCLASASSSRSDRFMRRWKDSCASRGGIIESHETADATLLQRRCELRLLLMQRPVRNCTRLAQSKEADKAAQQSAERPRLSSHSFHVRKVLELFLRDSSR